MNPSSGMGQLAKWVAILAAFSVLLVLITPPPDELPCTTGHKSPRVPGRPPFIA
jgi:hypothetical protein